jgi:hypothetical protein
MRLSRVILAKNLDGSMPAHTKGLEENLPVGTQIRSLKMLGPLDGAPNALTASQPFVSHCSLLWLLRAALTRLSGFCLQTLSFGRPHNNRGAHFEYDYCIL